MLCKHIVWYLDIIEYFVWLKESTIVCKYLVLLALVPGVHIPEILLYAVIKGKVFVIFFSQIRPLLYNLNHWVWWQQTTVFRKEDEQQAVEQLLRFLEKQQLPVFRVFFFGSRVLFKNVGKEHSLELWVIFIEGFCYLVFTWYWFILHLYGNATLYLCPCQAEV